MHNDRVEFAIDKIPHTLKTLFFFVMLTALISVPIRSFINRAGDFWAFLSAVAIFLPFLIGTIVSNIRHKGYKFVLEGGKTIIEYNNNIIIKKAEFSKIEGVKRGGVQTIGPLDVETDSSDAFPIIYGKDLDGKYLYFVPEINTDWNKLLYLLKKRLPELEIDGKLANYVSIDFQKRVFGKQRNTFQLVFLFVVIALVLVVVVPVYFEAIKNLFQKF